jgi:hypothetical protein
MGHLGAQGLNKLTASTNNIDFSGIYWKNGCVCDIYLTQKGKRRSYNHYITPGRYNLELIHLDIIGLVLIRYYDNSCFFVIFEYNKTRLAVVYCMKSKKEVTDYFIYFKKYLNG